MQAFYMSNKIKFEIISRVFNRKLLEGQLIEIWSLMQAMEESGTIRSLGNFCCAVKIIVAEI